MNCVENPIYLEIRVMDRQEIIAQICQRKTCSIVSKNKAITDEELECICQQWWNPEETHKIALFNSQRYPSTITYRGVLHFSKYRWNSLTCLDLGRNNIGDKGCKYLTRAHMPNLEQIYLYLNNYGNAGLLHLSKGAWVRIRYLCLSGFGWGQVEDFMRAEGYFYLVRGNWKKIFDLGMSRDNLTWEEVKTVLICEFPLEYIYLCFQFPTLTIFLQIF